MRDNRVGDEGAKHFGAASFNQLVLLDLRDNELSVRGARFLARGFMNNDTLTGLNLNGNAIANEGLWALGDALREKRQQWRRDEKRRVDDWRRLPREERWRVVAEMDGWTRDDFDDYTNSRPLALPPKDRPVVDEVRRDELERRKAGLVIPDEYKPQDYNYRVYFYGMKCAPRPLSHKLFGILL